MPNLYLTPDEQRQLLRTVRRVNDVYARRDAAWIELLIETGLRIGEFARLTVGQARRALESGWLYIPAEDRKAVRVKRRGERVVRQHEHRVRLYMLEFDLLNELLMIHGQMAGGAALHDDAPLIYSRNGDPLSVRSYQSRLQCWAKEAGLAVAANPHTLRHTTAMNILRSSTADNPMSLVSLKLGHIDPRTAQIYGEMRREELAQAGLDAVAAVRQGQRSKRRLGMKALRDQHRGDRDE